MAADSLEYLNSLNTRRFRCCCGHIHIKKGALIAGTIELFTALAIILICVIIYFRLQEAEDPLISVSTTTTADVTLNGNKTLEDLEPKSNRALALQIPFLISIGFICAIVFYIITILLMFIGIRRLRAALLIPHLIAQLLVVLCLATALVLSITVLASGYYGTPKDQELAGDSTVTPSSTVIRKDVAAVIVMILSSIMLGFGIWFLNIVYKCWRYLRARLAYQKLFYSTAPFTPPSTTGSTKALSPARGLITSSLKAYSPSLETMLPWIDSVSIDEEMTNDRILYSNV